MFIATAALVLSGCGVVISSTATSSSHSNTVVTIPGPVEAARHGCGVERWAVKTGTDPQAARVDLSPRASSIAALTSAPAPRDPTVRVAGVETQAWSVLATIVAIREESDSDYHLVLSDGQETMIAEAPAPACAAGSRWLAQIRMVRAAIGRACPALGAAWRHVRIPATLVGVGFFDRIHGQRGVARNGIELHPLLDAHLVGHC